MFVGPRSGYRQNSASFALRARKRGVNRCRELHGVQVSPRALWSQVCLRTIAFALRTSDFYSIENLRQRGKYGQNECFAQLWLCGEFHAVNAVNGVVKHGVEDGVTFLARASLKANR